MHETMENTLMVLVPAVIRWHYTESTWLYCDYFIWVYLVLCFNLYCGGLYCFV